MQSVEVPGAASTLSILVVSNVADPTYFAAANVQPAGQVVAVKVPAAPHVASLDAQVAFFKTSKTFAVAVPVQAGAV